MSGGQSEWPMLEKVVEGDSYRRVSFIPKASARAFRSKTDKTKQADEQEKNAWKGNSKY